MENTNINNTSENVNTTSDYVHWRRLLKACYRNRLWFLISVIAFLALALIYLSVTPPSYTRTASIVVMEEGSGTSSADMLSSLFSNLSVFRFKNYTDPRTNAKKELIFLQSDKMIEKVVRRLDLNVTYETEGRHHRQLLYGSTLPIMVSFLDLADNQKCTLTVNIHDGITLETKNETLPIRLGDTVRTEYGRLVVTPSLSFADATTKGMSIIVTHNTIEDAIRYCRGHLSADMDKDVPSIVNFTYTDINIERADDVLNTLFAAYSEEIINNKRKMADEMAQLIEDRIDLLKDELGDVDNDISTYKRDNSMADLDDIVKRARNKETETSKRINDIEHQIYLLRYLRKFILNPANFGQVLPSNTGINNNEIEHYVREHNDKQLERNDWAASITESSPLVTDLDIEIANKKKALVELIDNTILAQQAQLERVNIEHDKALGELANTPNKATYLVTIERQKKVKEQIYVYLLQKREENELSQVFSAANSLVIKAPTGSSLPSSPSYRRILFAALALGLLLPLAILALLEMSDTKVRVRKDVLSMNTPLLGEVPLFDSWHRSRRRRRKLSKLTKPKFMVDNDRNDPIAEAFRVVRTNLEFMSENNAKGKVIMVTSINANCGKTFSSANIGAAFAIKKVKTVCVDLDLRQSRLSRLTDDAHPGVSEYLSGNDDSIRVASTQYEYLDLLPVGDVKINPVELLSSSRLKSLIEKLRESYDMIILDCPPVEIVADASIIAHQADMTVFVTMAGLTDLSDLPTIDNYHAGNKYPAMALLLNGTIDHSSAYGYYGYYGYGYFGKKK